MRNFAAVVSMVAGVFAMLMGSMAQDAAAARVGNPFRLAQLTWVIVSSAAVSFVVGGRLLLFAFGSRKPPNGMAVAGVLASAAGLTLLWIACRQ